MAQVKIYGIREKLAPVCERLSETTPMCHGSLAVSGRQTRASFFMMEKLEQVAPRTGRPLQ